MIISTKTDSTTPSPPKKKKKKKHRFYLTNVSWSHNSNEEGCSHEEKYPHFLVCKGLLLISNDGVGVARGTVFQEIRPGAGFKKPATSAKKTVGGATVESVLN